MLVGVHEAALQLVYWSSLSYTHHCYLPFSFKIISQIRLLKPLHVSYFVKCLTVTEKGIDQHVSDFDELETLLLIFVKNSWFIYINLPPRKVPNIDINKYIHSLRNHLTLFHCKYSTYYFIRWIHTDLDHFEGCPPP